MRVKVFGQKIFASYCQKYSSRNPLECRSTRVSKKFMNDWGVEGERKRHVFTSNFFVSQYRKVS